MIFVTTGISGAPFDRLLLAIDGIDTDDELVVQHGPSQVRPAGATCVPFLPFSRLNELTAASTTLITHAGAGSVLVALTHGKRPIVVPRLPEFAEVVDNHQLIFGRHLARSGLVTLIEDPADLPQALAEETMSALPRNGDGSSLVQELSSYLHLLRAGPSSADESGAGLSDSLQGT
jgi:UDP-N-acetylglucosamine transferase subunit ALG13